MTLIRWALLAGAALSLGCAGPTLDSRRAAAAPAITALQQGSFERAEKLASEGVSADDEDPIRGWCAPSCGTRRSITSSPSTA